MKAKNTPLSKTLRKTQTPWETALWKHLRAKRTWPVKFKRQVPLAGFIVDFCCQEKRLVIEIDGSGHNSEQDKTKDMLRDKLLGTNGYKVLRFWNSEIDNNLTDVLEIIEKNITAT